MTDTNRPVAFEVIDTETKSVIAATRLAAKSGDNGTAATLEDGIAVLEALRAHHKRVTQIWGFQDER